MGEEDRLQKLEEDLLAGLDSEEKMEEENKDDKATKSSGKDNSTPPKLFLGYAAMVFVRTLIEALFIAGYFYLYVWKWIMPETYQCNREPCNDDVTKQYKVGQMSTAQLVARNGYQALPMAASLP